MEHLPPLKDPRQLAKLIYLLLEILLLGLAATLLRASTTIKIQAIAL